MVTKKIKRSLLINENTLLLLFFFVGGGGGEGVDLECRFER